MDQAAEAVEILLHVLRIDHQLVDDAGQPRQREIERHRGVRPDHALDRGMRDVALVPERHVLQRRQRIGAHHARQAGEVLRQHRIALVRHGRGALLPLGEELLRLQHLGALQMADFGGQPLDRGGDDAERGEIHGVAVARDDLGRDRLDCRPMALATCASTRGSTWAKVPTAPEMAQVATSLRAAMQPRAARGRIRHRPTPA